MLNSSLFFHYMCNWVYSLAKPNRWSWQWWKLTMTKLKQWHLQAYSSLKLWIQLKNEWKLFPRKVKLELWFIIFGKQQSRTHQWTRNTMREENRTVCASQHAWDCGYGEWSKTKSIQCLPFTDCPSHPPHIIYFFMELKLVKWFQNELSWHLLL